MVKRQIADISAEMIREVLDPEAARLERAGFPDRRVLAAPLGEILTIPPSDRPSALDVRSLADVVRERLLSPEGTLDYDRLSRYEHAPLSVMLDPYLSVIGGDRRAATPGISKDDDHQATRREMAGSYLRIPLTFTGVLGEGPVEGLGHEMVVLGWAGVNAKIIATHGSVFVYRLGFPFDELRKSYPARRIRPKTDDELGKLIDDEAIAVYYAHEQRSAPQPGN